MTIVCLKIVRNSFQEFVWLVLSGSVLSFFKGKKSSIASLSIQHGSVCVVDPQNFFSGKGSDDGLPVVAYNVSGNFQTFLFYKLLLNSHHPKFSSWAWQAEYLPAKGKRLSFGKKIMRKQD